MERDAADYDNNVLVLNGEARKVFVDLLLNPPQANAKALAAARRWKEEILCSVQQ